LNGIEWKGSIEGAAYVDYVYVLHNFAEHKILPVSAIARILTNRESAPYGDDNPQAVAQLDQALCGTIKMAWGKMESSDLNQVKTTYLFKSVENVLTE